MRNLMYFVAPSVFYMIFCEHCNQQKYFPLAITFNHAFVEKLLSSKPKDFSIQLESPKSKPIPCRAIYELTFILQVQTGTKIKTPSALLYYVPVEDESC